METTVSSNVQIQDGGSTSVNYVSSGWLDTPSSTIWYTPTYSWGYHTAPKIRLTLTEVEHLRSLAFKNKKLRETLRKFSPYIEVEVDFPGGK